MSLLLAGALLSVQPLVWKQFDVKCNAKRQFCNFEEGKKILLQLQFPCENGSEFDKTIFLIIFHQVKWNFPKKR